MWTEVTTRAGHRAWVAWDAEQADEGAVVVLEHDPEWARPWAATVLGPDTRDGIGMTPHEALRLAGCGLTPPDVGAEVMDDRGRRWHFDSSGRGRGWWCGMRTCVLRNGDVWWEVVPRDLDGDLAARIATLPDNLRGLARLNAASDVLDGRLDALPDGVTVTPEWRERCADTEPRTSRRDAERPEQDDRPVMAWWGPVDGGCYRWGLSTDPHGTVRTMRSQDPHPARYAEAMGWRAVEVSRD